MSDTNPIAYKNEIIRQQAERIEKLEAIVRGLIIGHEDGWSEEADAAAVAWSELNSE